MGWTAAAAGIMAAGSLASTAMSGGKGSTTSTQTSNPWWGQQQPLLNVLFNAGQDYVGAVSGQNMQYYPGSTYVPQNSNQINAENSLYNTDIYGGGSQAENYGQQGVANVINNATNNPGSALLAPTASGAYVNAGNPYQQAMIANTTAQVLPQITSQFAGGDRLDSGLASAAAAQGLGNAIGGLNYGQYTTEQQLQNQAAAAIGQNYTGDVGNITRALYAAPSIDQQYQQDQQTGINAIGAQQQDQQNALNADMQRWNYNQSLPWNADQLYAGLVNGNYGGTTTLSQPYYTNPAANIVSGVTGGLSMLGSLPGAIKGIQSLGNL